MVSPGGVERAPDASVSEGEILDLGRGQGLLLPADGGKQTSREKALLLLLILHEQRWHPGQ